VTTQSNKFAVLTVVAFMVIATECAWPQFGPLYLSPVTYSSGGNNNADVALGDVNGDGRLDVVAANVAGSVQVLLGNGDGTLQPGQIYTLAGVSASSVALADLDGDGRLDIVVSEKNSGCYSEDVVGVFMGNGDGTFQPEQTYKSGGLCAGRLAVADINGDGKPDVLVINYCSRDQSYCAFGVDGVIGVLPGNGDGSFQTAQIYDTGGVLPWDIVVADVNGDGKPDVLIANAGDVYGYTINANAVVLLGNGGGTFQKAQIFDTLSAAATGAETLAVADLNGDGKLDVVKTTCFYSDCRGGAVAVTVHLGNGDGTFQAPRTYQAGGSSASALRLADVDLDGKLDAVIVDRSECPTCATGGASVLIGNGDGTFSTPARHYSSGGVLASSAALGDLNGDGKPDLVVANSFTMCGARCNTPLGAVGVLLSAAKFLTNVSFVSSLSPSVYGEPVTFVATVTTVGQLQPTGTVAFKSATGSTIGTARVQSNGTAVLKKSNLNAGSFSLAAVYSGDIDNRSGTSVVVNQVVTQATSTATVMSTPNPSSLGQAVTFTAKITSPTVTPTGSVTFQVGKTVLGTAQLSAGKAEFTTSSLPMGSSTVTVIYQRNSNIKGSWASVRQTVQ
jgi:hypothetical protein